MNKSRLLQGFWVFVIGFSILTANNGFATTPSVTTAGYTYTCGTGGTSATVIFNATYANVPGPTIYHGNFAYSCATGTCTAGGPWLNSGTGSYGAPITISIPTGVNPASINYTAYIVGLPMNYSGVNATLPANTINCPVAPNVSTGTASAISMTGATLSGTLLSLGNPALDSVSFNYGTTTGYGSSTMPATSIANPISFAKDITGLTCATLYHFRAVASNSGSSKNGLDQTFTTSACPPDIIVACPGLSVSYAAAVTNWTLPLGISATGVATVIGGSSVDGYFTSGTIACSYSAIGAAATRNYSTTIGSGSLSGYKCKNTLSGGTPLVNSMTCTHI